MSRRPRVPFTEQEIANLVEGVEKFKSSRQKWRKILSAYEFNARRTSVDLKDKWRNIVRFDPAKKADPLFGHQKIQWSDKEVHYLKRGFSELGAEKNPWARILQRYKSKFNQVRTSVHLKDKWRNLARDADREAIHEPQYGRSSPYRIGRSAAVAPSDAAGPDKMDLEDSTGAFHDEEFREHLRQAEIDREMLRQAQDSAAHERVYTEHVEEIHGDGQADDEEDEIMREHRKAVEETQREEEKMLAEQRRLATIHETGDEVEMENVDATADEDEEAHRLAVEAAVAGVSMDTGGDDNEAAVAHGVQGDESTDAEMEALRAAQEQDAAVASTALAEDGDMDEDDDDPHAHHHHHHEIHHHHHHHHDVGTAASDLEVLDEHHRHHAHHGEAAEGDEVADADADAEAEALHRAHTEQHLPPQDELIDEDEHKAQVASDAADEHQVHLDGARLAEAAKDSEAVEDEEQAQEGVQDAVAFAEDEEEEHRRAHEAHLAMLEEHEKNAQAFADADSQDAGGDHVHVVGDDDVHHHHHHHSLPDDPDPHHIHQHDDGEEGEAAADKDSGNDKGDQTGDQTGNSGAPRKDSLQGQAADAPPQTAAVPQIEELVDKDRQEDEKRRKLNDASEHSHSNNTR